MAKSKIELDRNLASSNRPFYIISDNFKSDYKISKTKEYESVNNLMKDIENRYGTLSSFDNDYMKNLKSETIKYYDIKKY